MKDILLALLCTLFTASTLQAAGTPSNGPQTAPLAFENCPTAPVEFCDFTENSNEFWYANYWFDPINSSFDLGESEVNLQITATGAVSADLIQLHYELSLDLDGNGIPETIIKSKQLPGANKLGFNDTRAFDQRAVAVGDQYAFAIQTAVVNGKRVASVRWNTANNASVYVVPQLPQGTHSIKWIATDVSFNQITCVQTFVVKDCKKPVVVCIHGLSTNISTTGQSPTISATNFLLYGIDNATPANQLTYSVRKSGTGIGFPLDDNNLPITNVSFSCDDLGTQFIELWAIDKAGNADFCETYIIIQDNFGFCPNPPSSAEITGHILTPKLEGVEAAVLVNASYGDESFTSLTGSYNFSPPDSITNFVITPMSDVDPLSGGGTTYDLVLIQRHILNVQPFTSPYQYIAADANKSGTITIADILQLRRVILGIYTELPNNFSWRFVDRSQVFTDPNNPFLDVIQETITTANPPLPGKNFDFIAVKIGDITGSAQFQSIDDRSFGTLSFGVLDRKFEANEVFEVAFNPSEQPLAQQFTLNFEGLELLEVIPGEGMTSEDFGIFPNAMTTASFDVAGSFSVRFRAITAGVLSQKMRLDGRITPAKAYNMQHQLLDVALRFEQETTTPTGRFVAQPNTPNPFSAATMIAFELPAASEVQLSVYDALGHLVFEQKAVYTKGVQQIQLDARQLGSVTGTLFYELRTASGVATGKMMRF